METPNNITTYLKSFKPEETLDLQTFMEPMKLLEQLRITSDDVKQLKTIV